MAHDLHSVFSGSVSTDWLDSRKSLKEALASVQAGSVRHCFAELQRGDLRHEFEQIERNSLRHQLEQVQAGTVLDAAGKLDSDVLSLLGGGNSLTNQISAWCHLAQSADLTKDQILDTLLAPLERLNQEMKNLKNGSGEGEISTQRYTPLTPLYESFQQQRNRGESERAVHEQELRQQVEIQRQKIERLQQENNRLRQDKAEKKRQREQEYPTTAGGFVHKYLPDMLKMIEAGYREDGLSLDKSKLPFRAPHLAELLREGHRLDWTPSTLEQAIGLESAILGFSLKVGRYQSGEDTKERLLKRLRGYLARKPEAVPVGGVQNMAG